MSYQRCVLGQEEDIIWPNVQWDIPGGGPTAVYEPPIDWGTPGGVQIPPAREFPLTPKVTPQENYPYTTLPKQDSGWWGSITGALVPLSTAAANIIRAVTGQPVQPGSVYDPKTGKYIPPPVSTAQSWIIPVLLVGGGVLLISKMKKR